jgi:hypothetical protein
MKLHPILRDADAASSKAFHKVIQGRKLVNKTSSHRYERRKVRADLQGRGTWEE